jgi:hypothetical protein
MSHHSPKPAPPAELVKLGDTLREATDTIKLLNQRKRSASFKHLSAYSKNLWETEMEKATEQQMETLMKITELAVDNKVDMALVEALVKRSTR